MISGDTIAAVATAPGTAHRAVIRLSGPLHAIESMIDPFPRDRRVGSVQLRLNAGKLPCLALRFVGSASYTGEDSLELLIPGGPAVVRRVFDELVSREGVRPAGPGEFSSRAYLAGKLTVDQALGVEASIAAGTREQLDAAQRLLTGEFGATARSWTDRVTRLLALVEAGIDFTDQEDVTAIPLRELADELETLGKSVRTSLGSHEGGEFVLGLPRVVLWGAPSAGKSTLFNVLLGRERAVTDATPGTTRDALVERLVLAEGFECELVDLPGLEGGEADMVVLEHAGAADLCLQCDESGDFKRKSGESALLVRTKADRLAEPDPEADVAVCALSGEGLDRLRSLIMLRLRAARGDGAAVPWSLARHLAATERAIGAARDIAMVESAAPELIADRLREALDELGAITGYVGADDVLGRIFSSFCVGK